MTTSLARRPNSWLRRIGSGFDSRYRTNVVHTVLVVHDTRNTGNPSVGSARTMSVMLWMMTLMLVLLFPFGFSEPKNLSLLHCVFFFISLL